MFKVAFIFPSTGEIQGYAQSLKEGKLYARFPDDTVAFSGTLSECQELVHERGYDPSFISFVEVK